VKQDASRGKRNNRGEEDVETRERRGEKHTRETVRMEEKHVQRPTLTSPKTPDLSWSNQASKELALPRSESSLPASSHSPDQGIGFGGVCGVDSSFLC
jgi:hypothetical protein